LTRPEEKRQYDAATIAMRAVARVFAFSVHEEQDHLNSGVLSGRLTRDLSLVRCLLTIGAVIFRQDSKCKAAIRVASAAALNSTGRDGQQVDLAVNAVVIACDILELDRQDKHFKLILEQWLGAACDFARMNADFAAYSFLRTNNSFQLNAQGLGKAITFQEIKSDFDALGSDKAITNLPLWSGEPADWFRSIDEQMRKLWASDPNDTWNFWTRWWDGLVTGQPLDWALQEKVALIPDDIWQQGAAAVARAIREIEEQDGYHVSQATRAKAEKLLRAAIGTFTFDQVRGLITLGPFAEDLAFIKLSYPPKIGQ
jgi:hypothetical protein